MESQESDDEKPNSDYEEFKLPQLDWESLEAKLKLTHQEMDQQTKINQFNDHHHQRDKIRQKLTHLPYYHASSNYNNSNNHYSNRPSPLNSKQQNHLQICFINEEKNFDDNEEEEQEDEEEQHQEQKQINNETTAAKEKQPSSASFESEMLRIESETQRQLQKLKLEVRVMRGQRQKVKKKPSPIADIVGLSTYGCENLQRKHLRHMNTGQLQVITNDLFIQIERVNDDLKTHLMDRDDLFVQQDSILEDIEDLTKRRWLQN